MGFSSVDQSECPLYTTSRATQTGGPSLPNLANLDLFGIVYTNNTRPNDPSVAHSMRRLIVYALVSDPFSPRFEKATLSQPPSRISGTSPCPRLVPQIQFKHVLPTRPHAVSSSSDLPRGCGNPPSPKNRGIIESCTIARIYKAPNPLCS